MPGCARRASAPSAGECPECGRGFDLADRLTYISHAPFLGWVFWTPALLIATLGGTLTVAVMAYGFGSWRWALWIGLPFAAGTLVGYKARVGRLSAALTILIVACGPILLISTLGLAGVLAGMVLGAILLGPALLGMAGGAFLRLSLKRTRFSQRHFLPLLGIGLLQVACAAFETAVCTGRPIEDSLACEQTYSPQPK